MYYVPYIYVHVKSVYMFSPPPFFFLFKFRSTTFRPKSGPAHGQAHWALKIYAGFLRMLYASNENVCYTTLKLYILYFIVLQK